MAIKTSTDLIKAPAHALGNPDDVDYALRYRQVIIPVALDTAGASYSIPIEALGYDVLVTSIIILPGAALTSNDTNYKTINFKTGNQAGGALSTAIASVKTQTGGSGGTGDWVARTAITLFSGRQTIQAASTGYIEIAATGAGVALSGANFIVNYQVL